MQKEALTVCSWPRAGRLDEIEPHAEVRARTGHTGLPRLPPTPTRRNIVGTRGTEVGHHTASGLTGARRAAKPPA